MADKVPEKGENRKVSDKTTSTDNKVFSSPPSINIPKGGGAIRGIGEKFAANPVTGTGSLTVPIFTSPGRSGFGPQLSLEYDSGQGNGPFGIGWNLSLPSITRKTDKGLPTYQDSFESDVFILSGTEDLVPAFKKDSDGNFVLERGNLVIGDWFSDKKGNKIETLDEAGFTVRRYRPRIEGLFSLIERWTKNSNGDIHWRSISKDNILTVYGRDNKSRISDPSSETRVFSWLICESYDDKGNAILYEYVSEDDKNVDLSKVNERNRVYTANRYLKRIWYGNRKPLLLDTAKISFRKSPLEQLDFSSADWMFEVVFDYCGQDHYELVPLDKNKSELEQHQLVQASAQGTGKAWDVRPDPFSTYRSCFEVRTCRRCQRVLMFHLFPELGSEPYLVRSTEFDYADLDYSQPISVEKELMHKGSTRKGSFIRTVTQSGYVRVEPQTNATTNRPNDFTYLKASLPPLEFEYSQATINETVVDIKPESLENLPIGVDGLHYQLVDLDGEGLSGILTEQAGAWFYKPNLGNGNFGPLEIVSQKPSLANLNGGHQQLLDLAGDGQLDLADFSGPVTGFYERTPDQNWKNFASFKSLPNIPWGDPNLKFVDLTGDGHADILITEDQVFAWYPSLGEDGFDQAKKTYQPLNEEEGPYLIFADGTETVFLSDMSGDGLVDLVRIRNGEVCYWPNLGYGRFGSKVTMDNTPWFDAPDQFNPIRIRLADIDGSGTTDLIYLGVNGVQIYFNESGNSFSNLLLISVFPQVDNLSSVQVADLRGNGTACLVWSTPLTGESGRQMRYINLMGGEKPHLLVNSKNNLGAETKIHYVASTKFYLQDKALGTPWITRLPFPVHVVDQVETYDYISRNRFVTRYAYHHGYFDGIEREFRGFGMVEQWDTEEIDSDLLIETDDEVANWNAASFVPPILTCTWFHTGAYSENKIISKHFEEEYYHEGGPSLGEGRLTVEELKAMLLPDTVLPNGLTAEEERQACRALKGSILRQEIYSLDRKSDGKPTQESDRPYTISERNYTIKCLQPQGENQYAVFFVHPRETVDFHYERKLYAKKRADPRVTHNVIIEIDEYGNTLKSISIGYGRRYPDSNLSKADQDKQNQTLITYTENSYTNPIGIPVAERVPVEIQKDAYRIPLLSEARTFELINVNWQTLDTLIGKLNMSMPPAVSGITNLFSFNALQTLTGTDEFLQGEWDIPYEDVNHQKATKNNPYRRLIEQTRVVFRKNNLTSALPLGKLESLALPYQSYKLAFTSELTKKNYIANGKLSETDLNQVMFNQGGYVHLSGDKDWWLPSGQIFYSPDCKDTPDKELVLASENFFLPMRFQDPFGNITTAKYDNHDLLLIETCDPLENMIRSDNDYRVLNPRLITDPNDNRSEVVFNALGMVVATAVMGKISENIGDLLTAAFKQSCLDLTESQVSKILESSNPVSNSQEFLDKATTRLVYNLFAYKKTKDESQPQPALVCTLAREMHNSDLPDDEQTKIQCSFSYSDGFGREIQKKIQAEPGFVDGVKKDTRWVGSGWTIYNNKGKPVRQYEPFFSNTHQFEFAKTVGVSSVLFYDPLDRIVATLHPNNTFEKVIFDPWYQETYDVNDTVLCNPRTDEDISSYVAKYFNQIAPQPKDWKTWLQQRDIDPANPPKDDPTLDPEKKAAIRTIPHANTPSLAFFDSLGRLFLNVAQNSFAKIDAQYRTRILFDIEGNERDIHDEKNDDGSWVERVVMRKEYDMLGNPIEQESMEAGNRWMLNNVVGKPIRLWDSRGFTRKLTYDELQRPKDLVVTGSDGCQFLAERIVYGESMKNTKATKDPRVTNHRLKVWKTFDGAGLVVNDIYDFKGNLKLSRRQLLNEYKNQVDWEVNFQLEDLGLEEEVFTNRTWYDALNRVIQIIVPHSSNLGAKINVMQHIYNEANLLERVEAWLELDAEPNILLKSDALADHLVHFVRNIDYNAKGQRELIEYGNKAKTQHTYDPETFRLAQLFTTRGTISSSSDCSNPNSPCKDPPNDCPKKRTFKCGLQNLNYSYDPVGNIISILDYAQDDVFNRGKWVEPSANYTYDAFYRLTEAQGREQLGLTDGALNPPTPTSYSDDPRVRLQFPGNRDEMGTYNEIYTYDAAGNIKSVKHKGTNPQNPGWTRTYDYNCQSQIENGLSINNNRLTNTKTNDKGEDYNYDEHGNMTKMPHLHLMHWDFKDMLQATSMQKVENGGTPESTYYVYDLSGQRVRKVTELYAQEGKEPNRKDERVYLGGFEIYREYNEKGQKTLERETLHIMDDKQRVCLVDFRAKASEPPYLIRYQLGNHLGSVCLELDENANIISHEEYYPYGATSYQSVRKEIEVPLKRYRYTNKERDMESGLYYFGARYYVNWLGIWTSCDPAKVSADRLLSSIWNESLLKANSGIGGNEISSDLDTKVYDQDNPGRLRTNITVGEYEPILLAGTNSFANGAIGMVGSVDIRSGYSFVHNNPINRKDPDGKRDFIVDKTSRLYNSGTLLIEKMYEIGAERQEYWHPAKPSSYTKKQLELFGSRDRKPYVQFGSELLKKHEGTTNCSTAVLDAIFRFLGGKFNKKGKMIGGEINGVPLRDERFTGFGLAFQGENFAEALEDYDLGYKVEDKKDLKPGDIIGGGHRFMVGAIERDDSGNPVRFSVIEANLPTGTEAIKEKVVEMADWNPKWQIGRLYDVKDPY